MKILKNYHCKLSRKDSKCYNELKKLFSFNFGLFLKRKMASEKRTISVWTCKICRKAKTNKMHSGLYLEFFLKRNQRPTCTWQFVSPREDKLYRITTKFTSMENPLKENTNTSQINFKESNLSNWQAAITSKGMTAYILIFKINCTIISAN